MAAYAALVSVMRIIDDIQHHQSPPISLDKQQLQSLTQIITSLQEFLEAYNSPIAGGDEADPLEMRIADAAYAAENVIESHIVDNIHLATQHQHTSSVASKNSSFFHCFRAPNKPKDEDDEQVKRIDIYQDLQRVIKEMDSIKRVAMEIEIEKAVVVHDNVYAASQAPFNAMVCPDAVLHGIMEKLTGGPLDRHIIPIVGMGGIGKTTLARNIYAHPLIRQYFDVCVWTTISQQYNLRELLCEVLAQVTKQNKEELSGWSEDRLGSYLYKYLSGRRFLVVMDDMWSIDSWESIRHFFPNNESGNRVLVTTRLSQLSSHLNTNYSYQMEFLDEVSSWDLFSKTVFGKTSCPRQLTKIGKEIVENCKGLPLSIVVVAGLLKKMKQTRGCWESIRNNLTSIVNLENDKYCLRVLKLSYNHLPVYLKPCFLYMGVFEEDNEILVSTLIKLWVSEGFLKPMNGRSLETIAMGFFKDLVDRNLIRIDKLGSTGNIKSCKIHDLLRDLCLNESRKEGFHHVIGRHSPQGINWQCRRIVIPKNTSKKKVLEELKYMPHVRSVICENGKVPACRNFGLLRTFHAHKFRDYDFQSYRNSLAFQYVNLRYLAVEVDSTSSFFSSLSLFWNLHTLIVSCSKFHDPTASTEIWKMPQFRHIEFTESSLCLPDPPSSKDDDVVVLENLQILKGVRNFKCCEEVVKRIPNIKILKTEYYGQLEGTSCDDYYCVSNIKSLCKLESLGILFHWKCRGASSLLKLSFPQSLKKLNLMMGFGITWEEMLEKIASLPFLEKLQLRVGWCRTGKWEIVEGQFPKLKYLGLGFCPDLRQWRVEGSCALPRLEQLHVVKMDGLEEIPSEIGNIATLQKICVAYCSDAVVKSVKEMVEEQVELRGEEVPFEVEVRLPHKNQALRSLTLNIIDTIFCN